MANSTKIKWITYLVNILVALPVMGLISCGVFFIGYQLIFPRSNPPQWAEIAIPVLLDILFTTLYGIHQYRNIIQARCEIRRINNTALLGGIISFCFIAMVGFSILGQGKVNDPLGRIIVMAVLTVIPGGLIVWIFHLLKGSADKWHWNISIYLFSVGYVAFTSSLAGTVFAICQFDIWAKERTFFWNAFQNEFLKTGSLQNTAENMLKMNGDVSQCIGFILLEYEVKGMSFSISGGLILTGVFLLMLLARKWKYRAWFTALGVAVGLLLLGFGCYNFQFGAATGRRLRMHHSLQKKTMRDLKTVKPVISDEAILMLIDTHKQKREFGDNGWRLIEQFEGK